MKNHGVANGIFLGAAGIVITLGFYVAGLTCKLGTFLLISLIITILFMTRAGLGARKDNGGFINFKGALTPIFLTAVIAVVIGTIFQFLMFKVIDPDYDQLIRECTIQWTEWLMGMMGVPAEAIDQQLMEVEEQDFSFSIGNALKQLVQTLIGYFVLAAIIALIVRRKDPQAV